MTWQTYEKAKRLEQRYNYLVSLENLIQKCVNSSNDIRKLAVIKRKITTAPTVDYSITDSVCSVRALNCYDTEPDMKILEEMELHQTEIDAFLKIVKEQKEQVKLEMDAL